MAVTERDLNTTDTGTPGMRLSCDRKELLKALTAVKGTMGKHTYLPILSAVRLCADNGTLTIHGTNLDTAMAYDVPAQIADNGECAADFKGLLNAVKTLKASTVDLSHDGRFLNVDGGRGVINVPARWDVADYPVIPSNLTGQSFMLDSAELRSIAASVAPYAATDDTRPILTGAYFKFDRDSLTVTSADGFQLATRTTHETTGDDGTFILPASSLKLAKHLPDGLTFVSLSENRTQCEMQSGAVRITSRLIEGQYPNVKQIIPTKFAGYFHVSRADLAELLPMVLPVAKDNNNAITLEVEYDRETLMGTLTISAASAEDGEVRASCDVLASGDVPKVQFNGTYVKQIIASIDTPLLKWQVSGPNSASVIVPVDGPEHTVVLMPMHTR